MWRGRGVSGETLWLLRGAILEVCVWYVWFVSASVRVCALWTRCVAELQVLGTSTDAQAV